MQKHTLFTEINYKNEMVLRWHKIMECIGIADAKTYSKTPTPVMKIQFEYF